MKKLLSFIAAGALALGLIGCSGDLHDQELISLAGYGIVGTETSWKVDTSVLVKQSDGSYKYEFTYKDGDTFAITTPASDSDTSPVWANAYRWDGVAGAKDEVKFAKADTVYKVYQGDSANCMSLPCATEGDAVTVKIVPNTTYLEVTVTIVTPEAMYVAIDNAVTAMTPTATEGEYSYTLTGDGSDVTFKVFDGTDSYGLTTSGYVTTSTSLKKNGKAIKLATSNGNKFTIYVTKVSDGTLSVITKDASMKTLYSIASLNSNYGNYDIKWTSTSTGYTATVTIPTGTANSWGGKDTDDVAFGVCNDTSWGTKFTGATLAAAGTAYDLTKGAENNNTITGVNPSTAAVVITLVSTDSKITASYAQ